MLTRRELENIDFRDLTLPQARGLIIQMRKDIFTLFADKQAAIRASNKFDTQLSVSFNFICQQRQKLEQKVFSIDNFSDESEKVLNKIYKLGLEETANIKPRSGLKSPRNNPIDI